MSKSKEYSTHNRIVLSIESKKLILQTEILIEYDLLNPNQLIFKVHYAIQFNHSQLTSQLLPPKSSKRLFLFINQDIYY